MLKIFSRGAKKWREGEDLRGHQIPSPLAVFDFLNECTALFYLDVISDPRSYIFQACNLFEKYLENVWQVSTWKWVIDLLQRRVLREKKTARY